MTSDEWKRTLLAGAWGGAALTIEHLTLYDADAARDEPELTLFLSNVLGVGTLETVRAIVAVREGRYDEAARSITIAVEAGLVVAMIRLIRRSLRIYAETHTAAGHAAGLIDGAQIHDRAYRRATPRD